MREYRDDEIVICAAKQPDWEPGEGVSI